MIGMEEEWKISGRRQNDLSKIITDGFQIILFSPFRIYEGLRRSTKVYGTVYEGLRTSTKLRHGIYVVYRLWVEG